MERIFGVIFIVVAFIHTTSQAPLVCVLSLSRYFHLVFDCHDLLREFVLNQYYYALCLIDCYL